jgi:hypothetical protein
LGLGLGQGLGLELVFGIGLVLVKQNRCFVTFRLSPSEARLRDACAGIDSSGSQWRRQVSEFGGAFGGQTHILGGQDRIFKKVLLYRHWGTNILGISPPQRGECPRNIAPPFRIFATHICDVVYSNNFVILSSY